MNSFLRRHQKAMFAATIAIFVGGMFVGFGGYWFTDRDMQGVVARIGKEKITYQDLMTRVDLYADRLRQQGTDLDDAKMAQLKGEMLNNMMIDEMLALKARELGLVVTNDELSRDIRSTPAFARGGQFDQEVYFQTVRSTFHETPQQYERERRKAIMTARLKSLFFRMSKVSPAELREYYAAAHKGSEKGFDKGRDELAMKLQQQRALSLVNRCLSQMQTHVEVQNLLSKFRGGA
jgi:hypothetical protein